MDARSVTGEQMKRIAIAMLMKDVEKRMNVVIGKNRHSVAVHVDGLTVLRLTKSELISHAKFLGLIK